VATLGTVVYRAQVSDTISPSIPAEMAEIARESLIAAETAAQQLPDQLSTELLDVAREAFTAGLNTVAAVGAIVFVGLAVIAAAVLRQGGRSAGAEASAGLGQ
jgi:DHA2 family multidrug resistance protein-like MFS transporter